MGLHIFFVEGLVFGWRVDDGGDSGGSSVGVSVGSCDGCYAVRAVVASF